MKREINDLKKNNTWQLVKRYDKSDVVDCRWVYKLKHQTDGSVKYKARLVARGFSQVYGENYWDTYAPVVKSSTIRMLMACAVERDMCVEQIDVRNAYVKSDLKEIIYMRQPYGFEEGGDDVVCKLNKSLYGLKQAGFEWNKCLNTYLENELKFERLKSDPCVYINNLSDNIIIITIYVDDILIFSKDPVLIRNFKSKFNTRFEIDDMEQCKKIIGIEVERAAEYIDIHQRAFIKEIIGETKLGMCHPVQTPVNTSLELVCPEEDCGNCELIEGKEYRSIVGKLQYLAGSTRPDIKYACSNLARFNERPHKIHWDAAMRVVRYLKGTIQYRIRYKKTGKSIYAYSDADYANCKQDRRSYTGYVLILGGGPISWESKKQPTVALSSAEAEYMAITSAAKEIMFCRSILEELGFTDQVCGSTTLYSDNIGAIELSRKNGFSARTKHIDVRHHYIRALVEKELIKLDYVSTKDMLADVMTKGLGSILHKKNVSSLLID